MARAWVEAAVEAALVAVVAGNKKNAAGGDLISACGDGHPRVRRLQSPHAAFYFPFEAFPNAEVIP